MNNRDRAIWVGLAGVVLFAMLAWGVWLPAAGTSAQVPTPAVALPMMVRNYPPPPSATPTSTPTNTPTSTPTSTPTNTPTSTPTSTPTNTPTNTPTPTNTTPPQSDLVIGYLNYDSSNEYVRIANVGTAAQVMTGWSILSVVGSQRYHFPAGYMLAAGENVYVHSGQDASNSPPLHLFWTTAYIWNNAGDKAELYDANGNLVDDRCYKDGCP